MTGVVTRGPYSYPVTNASCDDLQLNPLGSGDAVIQWDNGQTSTLTGLVNELTVTGGILQETATGTVSAGEFSGGAAVITWDYVVDPLQCLAPGGLTVQDGTILIQIISA